MVITGQAALFGPDDVRWGGRLENNRSYADQLKSKIRQVQLLKYAVIITFLAFGGSVIYFIAPTAGSSLRLFAETFLYSGVGALALSLFTDFFQKAETQEALRVDRTEFATTFAREFFLTHADAVVTDEMLLRLMGSESRRSVVVRSLASLLTTDQSLRSTVEQSYLEPLHKPPRFKNVRATSHLRNYNEADGTYTWSCNQVMTSITTTNEFRVFACLNNDIAAMVEASTRATDFVVLLSDIMTVEDIREWLRNKFVLRAHRFDAQQGRTDPVRVSIDFDMSELRAHPGCAAIGDNDGVYCKFSWPAATDLIQIEFRFDCKLSLREDPFFVWTLQEYTFVDSIEIDYSGLLGACGRASVIPFVSNSNCFVEHNRELGAFRILFGGLTGPGEGAVIIFRPNIG